MTAEKKGQLYGVGVGPGNPECLTLEALHCIEKADVIAIPNEDASKSVAYRIAQQAGAKLHEKPVIGVPIPMTKNLQALDAAYEEGCCRIVSLLEQGQSVAFLNLGDPVLYGTYMRLHLLVKERGYEVKIVNAVSSVFAVAGKLHLPLGMREESVHIVAGNYGKEEIVQWMKWLEHNDCIVIMKTGQQLGRLKEQLLILEEQGIASASAVTNCGMKDEQIFTNLSELPEDAGYFTTIMLVPKHTSYIVKNQKKLRCGVTTGSCSAAAARAAAVHLLTGKQSQKISLQTPKGVVLTIPVELLEEKEDAVSYCVMKDSGDDPDVTNGTRVCVTISRIQNTAEINKNENWFYSKECPGLSLDGGIGIGRVTKAGLQQKIGQAAINEVPRKMIFEQVQAVCEMTDEQGFLHIEVWMPDGEALAKKTFNPKLGIEGGLSILGTSGVIEPMSEASILATIETEIRQQQVLGTTRLLVTPGNYGQSYASKEMGYDISQSVKCSNYIGETIDMARSYGMKEMLLVGDIGKLVKLAAGIFMTHSKQADGRGEIFTGHAALAGAKPKILAEILHANSTETMLDLLEGCKLREQTMQSILDAIECHVSRRAGENLKVGVVIFSRKYGYLGQTQSAQEIRENNC